MPQGAAKTQKKSLYRVHPGVLMVQKGIAELPQRTGKSLDEWISDCGLRIGGGPS